MNERLQERSPSLLPQGNGIWLTESAASGLLQHVSSKATMDPCFRYCQRSKTAAQTSVSFR